MPILEVRMVKGTRYTKVKVVRIDDPSRSESSTAEAGKGDENSSKFLALVHSDVRDASPAPEPSTVSLFLPESTLFFHRLLWWTAMAFFFFILW